MQLNSEITWEAVIAVFGFLATIVSLIYAAREVTRNTRTQRAAFLIDLTERYFADDEVRRFFYKIDYNNFTYDEEKFPETDEERWLDTLLYTFDVIGLLFRTKVVTVAEVEVFAFQASRVLNNPEVKRYLDWLDGGDSVDNGELGREGITTRAHDNARYLVEQLFPEKHQS